MFEEFPFELGFLGALFNQGLILTPVCEKKPFRIGSRVRARDKFFGVDIHKGGSFLDEKERRGGGLLHMWNAGEFKSSPSVFFLKVPTTPKFF